METKRSDFLKQTNKKSITKQIENLLTGKTKWLFLDPLNSILNKVNL